MSGYTFSEFSRERLASCAIDLQRVAEGALEVADCRVLEGHRSAADQHAAFMRGASRIDWEWDEAAGVYVNPGPHGQTPSAAIDIAPYPIDWDDTRRFCMFAGVMLAKADALGIELRWGGDWDRDFRCTDQSFNDLVHFELVAV